MTLWGQVDPDGAEPLVQRVHGELHQLLLGPSELGVVAGVGRLDGPGDQGEALDQRALDDRRETLGVLAHRLLEDLHAEVDVTGLVPGNGGEAPVEAVMSKLAL